MPNIKYFIETALYAKGDRDNKEMLFKLEKYGRNILLEEDKEIERKILGQQYLTFFTSISNINIDDNLYFKFEHVQGVIPIIFISKFMNLIILQNWRVLSQIKQRILIIK